MDHKYTLIACFYVVELPNEWCRNSFHEIFSVTFLNIRVLLIRALIVKRFIFVVLVMLLPLLSGSMLKSRLSNAELTFRAGGVQMAGVPLPTTKARQAFGLQVGKEPLCTPGTMSANMYTGTSPVGLKHLLNTSLIW